MKSPKLDGIPDMPFDKEPNPRAQIGGNQGPPLEEAKIEDLMASLRQARDGKLLGKIEEFTKAAERLGPFQGDEGEEDPYASNRIVTVEDEDTVARLGDFYSQCGKAIKLIEEKRVEITKPLLDAQRAVKGRADSIAEPLHIAQRKIKSMSDDFMRREKKRRDEEEAERRRKWEEEQKAIADAARAKAEEEGDLAALAEEPDTPPPPPPPPAAERFITRSDYGTTTSAKKKWIGVIEKKVRGLPDSILENEKVREAVTKVIQQQVTGGARTIKGAKIYEDSVASFRG